MGRRRRYIRSKRVYELILRAREGLPFPALILIKLIIESSLARTQRYGGRVKLCHDLWMGNHVHLIIVSMCAEACVKFYQELQKKITESMKRLLGLHRLNIWEGDPVLAEVLDLEAAIKKIAYVYANPARADLVDRVSDYPGYSSWEVFNECSEGEVDTVSSKRVPWVRLPAIEKAPGRALTERQDKFLRAKLIETASKSHELEIHPNAWMKVFNIKDKEEVFAINQRIKARVLSFEAAAREKRQIEGRHVIGKEALKRQEILKPHTPKKKGCRVFVISSVKELRISFIEMYNAICDRCAQCYENWRKGDTSMSWPPGTFRPPLGVLASAVVF